ncbi:phosphatidate cytidylyltransferase [bacterium]|nr:phosphatidate cytidylyltransferase [candidate division CSSED10-310 bacterium]
MSNILTRYIVALIAIPTILYILFCAPSWVFNLLMALIMMLVLLEWLHLIQGLKLAAPLTLGMTMGAVLLTGITVFAVTGNGLFLFFTSILAVLGLNLFGLLNQAFDIKQRALGNAAMLMAVMMTAWGGGSIILIRESETIPDSRYWILLLFTMVWSGDTGAMHLGRRFGRHKLAPVISPKKTVEGLVGAVTCATITSAAVFHLFHFPYPLWHVLIIAPITVALAHTGDLTASMIKRAAQVKDSGHLIPGHGGYLDRFDALLLSSPFVYLYIQLVLIHP